MRKRIKFDINQYCKTSGIIMIALGVIHIMLSGFLSSIWGYFLILAGIFSLIYRRKAIVMLVGIMLIFVGLLNITDSIIYGINFLWFILGGFQIYWGIQEIIKYTKIKVLRIRH